MTLKAFLFSLAVIGLSSNVFSQNSFVPPSYSHELYPLQDSAVELKKPATAMWISIGASAVFLSVHPSFFYDQSNRLLNFTGVLLLSTVSSSGYLYTGNTEEFFKNTGFRLSMVGLGIIGGRLMATSLRDAFRNDTKLSPVEQTVYASIFLTAFAGYTWSSLRDFSRVRKVTREYNKSLIKPIDLTTSIDQLYGKFLPGIKVKFKDFR